MFWNVFRPGNFSQKWIFYDEKTEKLIFFLDFQKSIFRKSKTFPFFGICIIKYPLGISLLRKRKPWARFSLMRLVYRVHSVPAARRDQL